MTNSISYGKCVIHAESFELMPACGWIPRFTLIYPERSLLCRDHLDKLFASKEEADKFALGDAMDWIDDHEQSVAEPTLPSS